MYDGKPCDERHEEERPVEPLGPCPQWPCVYGEGVVVVHGKMCHVQK